MGKIKKIFEKSLIVLLLFVGFGLNAQEYDETKTVGFVVTPKNYKTFHNKKSLFDLNSLLVDEETEWSGKKKAFGMYAFNLKDNKFGFFIGDRLVGEGDIIKVNDFESYIIVICVTIHENKSLLVKYFISLDEEHEYDFACWWYDEGMGAMRGEVSKKIKVELINENN